MPIKRKALANTTTTRHKVSLTSSLGVPVLLVDLILAPKGGCQCHKVRPAGHDDKTKTTSNTPSTLATPPPDGKDQGIYLITPKDHMETIKICRHKRAARRPKSNVDTKRRSHQRHFPPPLSIRTESGRRRAQTNARDQQRNIKETAQCLFYLIAHISSSHTEAVLGVGVRCY